LTSKEHAKRMEGWRKCSKSSTAETKHS
jgi:hypothetical protein